ncbi:MAG: hypothetical protein IPJ14_07060 [Kineosporiaceae bacterium]|nr:hypothetical protein [Kineosporiaceae bacterium]
MMNQAREQLPNSPSQRHRLGEIVERGLTGRLQHCLTVGVELSGPLDLQDLRGRFAQMLERRPALRAVFGTEGSHALGAALPEVRVVEVDGPDQAGRWRAAEDVAAAQSAVPFPPEATTRARLTVVTAGPRRHLLVLAVDPLVCDAWSVSHLVEDLLAPAGTAPDGYSRLWRRRQAWLTGPDGSAAVERRRAAVRGAWHHWPGLEPIGVHTPPGDVEHPEAEQFLALDEDVAAALHAAIRTGRSTMLAVAAAALVAGCVDAVELRRSADPASADAGPPVRPPLALRSTFAAREDADEQAVVGGLATEVVLRLPTREGTIAQYLRTVRAEVFQALADQRVPWELVQDVLADGVPGGPTCAMVYLPKDLSGGRQAGRRLGEAIATRTAVSICPTGADLDLFVIEGAPPMRRVQSAALTLGASSWCGHTPTELDAVLRRWADSLDLLARTDWGTGLGELVEVLSAQRIDPAGHV